ncbi:MAG: hypothetical protein ACE5GH_06695 [Fidelibacterota bacterium]
MSLTEQQKLQKLYLNTAEQWIEDEEKTKKYCLEAWEEGRAWTKESEEVQNLDKYISYLLGKQWPNKRPSYKATPVNNRLLRTLEETQAILTDIRHIYQVKALNKIWDDQAKMLTRITKAWWIQNDSDMEVAMVLVHAYLSTGYIRIGGIRIWPMGRRKNCRIGPVSSTNQ